jgi:hypothetical protein
LWAGRGCRQPLDSTLYHASGLSKSSLEGKKTAGQRSAVFGGAFPFRLIARANRLGFCYRLGFHTRQEKFNQL